MFDNSIKIQICPLPRGFKQDIFYEYSPRYVDYSHHPGRCMWKVSLKGDLSIIVLVPSQVPSQGDSTKIFSEWTSNVVTVFAVPSNYFFKQQQSLARMALKKALALFRSMIRSVKLRGIPELASAIERGNFTLHYLPDTEQYWLELGNKYQSRVALHDTIMVEIDQLLNRFSEDLTRCLQDPTIRMDAPIQLILNKTENEMEAANIFLSTYFGGDSRHTLRSIMASTDRELRAVLGRNNETKEIIARVNTLYEEFCTANDFPINSKRSYAWQNHNWSSIPDCLLLVTKWTDQRFGRIT